MHDQRNSSAPPCPTIFVANLGPACTEHELTQVFSRFENFFAGFLFFTFKFKVELGTNFFLVFVIVNFQMSWIFEIKDSEHVRDTSSIC